MKKSSIFLFMTIVFFISNPTLIYADLFISTYSTNSIQRYDVQSQTFVKIIEGLNNPQKILFGPDNNLYVITYNTATIKQYDGQTYQFIDDFVSPMFPGQIKWIESLAFGPDDNLYVLSRGTSSILRYNGQTGAFIDIFANGYEFNVPLDLVFGPDGNLYITNAGTNNIEYYNGRTGDYLGTFIHTGNAVTDIDFGPDGNLYAYEQTERILRYDGQSGNFINVFASVKAGDFVFGPDNDLYVSLASGYGVNHYNGQTGTFIETLSGGIYSFPTGLAFPVPIPTKPDISVSPSSLFYDFGDVELGSTSTVLISISNEGDADLTLTNIGFQAGSSNEFSITSSPSLPVILVQGANSEVEISYNPLTDGFSSATLDIGSNDPDEPLVKVDLTGKRVYVETPPSKQIVAILGFIETSVLAGTLEGDGPGNSAEKRLNALMNMIDAAADLIAGGAYEEACEQLKAVYKKVDSSPKPPDFCTGPAISELASMISDLIGNLNCLL